MGLRRFFERLFGFIGDVVSWLTGAKDKEFDSKQQGYLLNKQSNIEPIPVVYGKRKIGGTRVFVATSGSDNEYLYVVLALCEGEIQAIDEVYIDDVISTDSRFTGYLDIYKYLGTDAQTANTTFVNANIGWTSSHKLSGVAYLAIRFKFNADVYASGIPTVHAVIRGKKVYDPRTSSTAYSDNPALCLRDYLTNTRYGKGLSSSLINDTQFISAANTCENTVTKYTGASSDTQLFQCNAVLDTSQTLFDNVKILLTGMRGLLPFQNGQYGLIIDGDPSSSFAFTHDNIVGGITISSANKNTRYNQVVAKFVNPDTNWQSDSITYPEVDSSDDTTWLSEDNGERLRTEITLPTTTDAYVARDIARVVLYSSRNQSLQVSFIATSEALQCAVGDVVTVTHETPAWTNKEFKVQSLELLDNGEVNVIAQEHDGAIYTWETNAEVDAVVESTLPNPFVVAPPTSLSATEITTIANDGTLQPALLFEWTASADSFVTSYEVQWFGTYNPDWGSINNSATESEDYDLITEATASTDDYGSITDANETDLIGNYQTAVVLTNQYVLPAIQVGAYYDFKVRGINELGVKSAFISLTGLAGGDTTAPATPTGLTVTAGLKTLIISWVNPTDNDFSHVNIYENTTDNYSSATLIGRSGGTNFYREGLDYGVTRYYWVTAVDYTGNESTQSASANGTTEFVDTDAFTAEVEQLFEDAGLYGIEPLSSLPASGDFTGQVVFLTTDNKLYRWTGSAWTTAVPAVDITGQLTNAQLQEIAAAKISGQLTNAQLEDIATSKLTGTITETQIGDDSISTAKLQAASISTAKIASGAITTGLLAAEAVTTEKLGAGSVSTAKLVSGSVTTDILAASSITSAKIAAGAVVANSIASNVITGDKIVANTITGGLLATSGIITSVAQIGDSLITNAKISNGAITTAKIGDAEITTLKIGSNQVTVPASAYTSGSTTIYGDYPDFPPAGVTSTIQSISVSATASLPVFLNGSCLVTFSTTDDVYLSLWADSTELIKYNRPEAGDFWVIQYVYTPASTTTYNFYLKLQYTPSSGTSTSRVEVEKRLLTAIQTKR